MLDFIGIGAQKAGTTWLYANLALHPEIDFPGGKEVHFWDAFRDRGVEWYQSLFTTENGCKHGDITPAYSMLTREVIQEVYALAPAARLVFMVRNPIDRAWSSALMALKRAEMTPDEASDQWFIDHFKSEGSRLRGNYVRTVDNWLSVYPEEQLLVIGFDDISTQPERVLQRCARHIGVDEGFYVDTVNMVRSKVHEGQSVALRQSLRIVLADMYADQLAAMRVHPVLGDVASHS